MMDRRIFIAGTAIALAAPLAITKSHGATPRQGRDVQSFAATDPFFSKYAQAVKKMHDLPSSEYPRNWRDRALIHINHCPHGTQSFVHWHRHYLLNFELICGEMIGDTDFALPYWNWSAKNGTIPDPFFDLGELNVVALNDPSNAQSDNWGPDKVVTIGIRGLSKGQGLQDDPDAGQIFYARLHRRYQAINPVSYLHQPAGTIAAQQRPCDQRRSERSHDRWPVSTRPDLLAASLQHGPNYGLNGERLETGQLSHSTSNITISS